MTYRYPAKNLVQRTGTPLTIAIALSGHLLLRGKTRDLTDPERKITPSSKFTTE
jgi:hypothetical protein